MGTECSFKAVGAQFATTSVKLGFALLCLLPACGEDVVGPGAVLFTTGQETDTWTREPAPTTIDVEKILETGERTAVGNLKVPSGGFTLDSGGVGSYDVLAKDAAGIVQVRGTTLLFDPAGLAGTNSTLFLGRAGEFSRPPGNLTRPPGDGPHLAMAGPFLFIAPSTAPSGSNLDAYDLYWWAPTSYAPVVDCPKTPCAIRSLAISANYLMLSVGEDWGRVYNLDAASGTPVQYDAPLPPGLTSYAEISGGRTVIGAEGWVFVVGATRTSSPTNKVLAIDPEGTLSTVSLLVPRAGAAATWVDGTGLVVTGGSATGAGAELMAQGSSAFVALDYPSNATSGAGLAALDNGRVLQSGGTNPDGTPAATVELALGCGSACVPVPRAQPIDATNATSFGFPGNRVLTVGDSATGETRAYWLEAERADPLTLREPRRGARAIALPNGQIALAGGTRIEDAKLARSLEFFTVR